ncbi:hypothetical protein ACTQZF_01805 [Collinsella sp. LCP19S3_H3]|uniref:hypothetical protein n=1 Tax=Collinsella sp. LCP19S3_H3 TaxID=3438768 RepID=UPI003F9162B2
MLSNDLSNVQKERCAQGLQDAPGKPNDLGQNITTEEKTENQNRGMTKLNYDGYEHFAKE